jgi:hypothetical protein
MCHTNSSTPDLIGASLKAALLLCDYLCTMRDTYSTLDYLIGTSLEAASVDKFLCAMRFTHSSRVSFVGTSLDAASRLLSTMRDTNSSLLGQLGTSRLLALAFAHFAKYDTAIHSLDEGDAPYDESVSWYAEEDTNVDRR